MAALVQHGFSLTELREMTDNQIGLWSAAVTELHEQRKAAMS